MRNQVRKAFTLVEILIVVVILGILAAIVIPQFTSATQDAQAGNLNAQLQSLQSQIELYKARNNNAGPFDLAQDWLHLRGDLDDDNVTDTGLEGYIKKNPTNPAVPSTAGFANDSIVIATTAGVTGSAAAAWVWNEPEGLLYASYFNESTGEISQTATD
ncbi:MAG TPA: type II secretion system protein [Phycisphaerales bacterium]|nr:type II secretion system protein [Phycisphaerales bacterium]